MTPKDVSHDIITLRVKQNSELDRMIKALRESETPLTDAELKEIGGYSRSPWILRVSQDWFDNIRVMTTGDRSKADKTKNRISYVELNPAIPVPVGIDVSLSTPSVTRNVDGSTTVTQAPPPLPTVDPMTWPQMPPIPMGLGDKFREPGYYKTVERMVKLGKHVAFAGPPGVGKDTVIEQLAADAGIPLVTVGGDAGLRKRDLVGSMEILNGSTTFRVAEFAAAVVNGWWASITEINAADPDVTILLNALMAAPYVININGKAYGVHPDFRLFVSYNPGLIGTKPLAQSFKDRFYSVKVPFFNMTQLRLILEAHGMPKGDDAPEWARDIVLFGMDMWDAYERGVMRYQVTSRRLMDAVVLMSEGLTSDVKTALRLAVIDAIDSPVEAKAAETVLGKRS